MKSSAKNNLRNVFRAHTGPGDEQDPPVIIGASSLLVIFSVLCLTVFAMMSLSTVQMDERLLSKTVETVRARAEADAEAQKRLSELRNDPEASSADGELHSFSCPVSDHTVLRVEVIISGTEYEIIRWQEETVGDWMPDDTLHLWNGSKQTVKDKEQ